MTRASGTTRGSAVRSPGTSFQSETREAPSPRASSVAVRSEPPRPERGHLAVGRGADEAGHDRDDAAREQRQQRALDAPIGAGEVRRRLAERAVGVDEVDGIDVPCLRPGRLERRRHQARAQPLAARGEVVGGARGELAQELEPLCQGLELLEDVADVGQRVRPAAARGQERPCHLGVAAPELRDEGRDGARLAGAGLLGHAKERVGRPRHRRDDHDGGLLGMAADDVDGVADSGGVGQRRTAELVHLRRSAGPWHKP